MEALALPRLGGGGGDDDCGAGGGGGAGPEAGFGSCAVYPGG